jgi:hypothetical protein
MLGAAFAQNGGNSALDKIFRRLETAERTWFRARQELRRAQQERRSSDPDDDGPASLAPGPRPLAPVPAPVPPPPQTQGFGFVPQIAASCLVTPGTPAGAGSTFSHTFPKASVTQIELR